MTVKTAELVRVEGLKKYFKLGGRSKLKSQQVVKAVDGLRFSIFQGETLGIVGESGCGKSTTGRLLLRLLEPTTGKIYFEGQDMTLLSKRELRKNRRHFQMIFQDPYASLNPRMTIKEIIDEPLKTFHEKKDNRDQQIKKLIDAVGISASSLNRYPHEFSGGQRQRIGIARSLALNPKFIVADEPVAALDVSIQAQILNLMKDLQEEFAFTYLFIAHDLGVVNYMSDRIGVMYLGKMVELADSDTLYTNPVHPYTKSLLASIPIPDPSRKRKRMTLEGELPSPVNPPTGCRFHTRCPWAKEICQQVEPDWIEVETNHFTACHVVQEQLL